MLAHSRLPIMARDLAIRIFALLAAAEAEVQGVREEEVAFHEVGAIDSIVDIVAAGQLIALLDARCWTSAPLPLGSGRVRTQHGLLPVPAPASTSNANGMIARPPNCTIVPRKMKGTRRQPSAERCVSLR